MKIELYVVDAGEGIPSDAIPKIFEPFFTTKATGMGMGLAISRSIVERHGGSISLTSESGSGCTLERELPIDGALLDGRADGPV